VNGNNIKEIMKAGLKKFHLKEIKRLIVNIYQAQVFEKI